MGSIPTVFIIFSLQKPSWIDAGDDDGMRPEDRELMESLPMTSSDAPETNEKTEGGEEKPAAADDNSQKGDEAAAAPSDAGLGEASSSTAATDSGTAETPAAETAEPSGGGAESNDAEDLLSAASSKMEEGDDKFKDIIAEGQIDNIFN